MIRLIERIILGAYMLVTPLAAQVQTDPFEPNNTAAAARQISYGFVGTALTIFPEKDVDYFKFVANSGDFVIIEAVTDEGTGLDVRLALLDGVGGLLVEVDNVASGVERIQYGVDRQGTYYLRVAQWEDTGSFPNSIGPRSKVSKPANHTFAAAASLVGPYTLRLDLTKPLPPNFLSAGFGFHSIVPLRWEAPRSNGPEFYAVYRSFSEDGPFEPIGSTYREDFVDTSAVNGTPSFYRVTAVYASTMKESPPSNTARGTPRAGGYRVASKLATSKVSVDGVIGAEEWNDALTIEMSTRRAVNSPLGVRWYVKNDEKRLYFAVSDSNGGPATWNRVVVAFDRNDDDTWPRIGPSPEGVLEVDDSAGVAILRYYGITGAYPNFSIEDERYSPEGIEAALGYSERGIEYEFALDITKLSVSPSASPAVGVYLAVFSDDLNGELPPGALIFAPVTFVDVALARPALPTAPALSSPADRSTGVPIGLTLVWNAAPGSAMYHLQVSSSSTFDVVVVDDSSIVSNSREIGPLTYGTTYYWRVASKNFVGKSSFSTPWSFTTVSAPSIVVQTPVGGWATGFTYTIAWTSTNFTGNVTIRLSLDGGATYSTIASNVANTGTYSFRVPISLTPSGNCKLRVEAAQNPNLNGESQIFAIVSGTLPGSLTLSSSTSFPAEPTASTAYRLISIPGEASSVTVGQLLTAGSQKIDWRIFRDDGVSPSFSELSAASTLRTGEGYWLIKKGPFTVSRSIPSVGLEQDATASIALHPGWNIIGNPFDKPVSWPAVLAANGLTASAANVIFDYNGSYSQSGTLEPYKGYYYNNSQGLTTLKIPYPFFGKLDELSPHEVDWRIQLVLETDINADPENYIGVAPSAHVGLDELEAYKPPLFLDQGFLYFPRPEWDRRTIRFGSDFRPEVGEGQVWEFEVSNPRRSDSRIRFLGVETVPVEYGVVLIDIASSTTVDLRGTTEVSFRPEAERSRFRLVVGRRNFIEEEIAQIAPTEFELSQNYPNPFNPSTTIRLRVPREALVSVDVISLLGQRVRTLLSSRLVPSSYLLAWDGTDAAGARVASGVYFYRLTVDGTPVQTKRMILLR